MHQLFSPILVLRSVTYILPSLTHSMCSLCIHSTSIQAFNCGLTGNRTPNSAVTGLHYSRLTMRPLWIQWESNPNNLIANQLDCRCHLAHTTLYQIVRNWLCVLREHDMLKTSCSPTGSRTRLFWMKTKCPNRQTIGPFYITNISINLFLFFILCLLLKILHYRIQVLRLHFPE